MIPMPARSALRSDDLPVRDPARYPCCLCERPSLRLAVRSAPPGSRAGRRLGRLATSWPRVILLAACGECLHAKPESR
jgi:hypothetical protein